MTERKTLLGEMTDMSGNLVRGLADRVKLVQSLLTDGPLTPYADVCDQVYIVDKFPVVDLAWAVLMGYHGGFCYFADFRSKDVVPPLVRQEVDPPGFVWSDQGGYHQLVWRGCLKPDRER